MNISLFSIFSAERFENMQLYSPYRLPLHVVYMRAVLLQFSILLSQHRNLSLAAVSGNYVAGKSENSNDPVLTSPI